LHAVRVALQVHAEPAVTRSLQAAPLPDGIIEVLRLAAESKQAHEEWSLSTGATSVSLTLAARFYIEQILMVHDADHYRVLGVSSGATSRTIRDHYRWLIRWLHPDRETSGWHSVLAERVNRAYIELRHAGRRAEYDEARRNPSVAAPAGAKPHLQPALRDDDGSKATVRGRRRWWQLA
jgi:hypothetical protein